MEQNKVFPRNFQEFIEQGWVKKIELKCRKFNLNDVNNDIEDLTQDILVALLKKDANGKTYIEKYDASNRSFEVYLYVFVENFLKKRWTRENTKFGKLITTRASLEPVSPKDGEEMEKGVVYLDMLKAETYDDNAVIQFNDFINRTLDELKGAGVHSEIYDGTAVIRRDAATTFDLILQGFSIMEISEKFKVSRQQIYNLVKKIRKAHTVREFFNR